MGRELKNGDYVYDCPDCGSKILYDESRRMLKCEGCGVLKVKGVLKKIGPEETPADGGPDVLMTARRGEERYLLEDLGELGKFESSAFRDVVIGKVNDRRSFLDELNSGNFPSLSRVVPIYKSLEYSEKDFRERLSEAIRPYADQISTGKSFKINFTRRGLKGQVNSQEIEREMGSIIWKELEKQDKKPTVDLEDPDKTVIIESLGRLFLIGFVTREMKEKYYTLDLV